MMHLVKNKGKYLVNGSDIETIRKYGGEDAKIIFSWEEDNQDEALINYFSNLKVSKDLLELYVISGIVKSDICKCIDKYYEEDMDIIEMLNEIELISTSEKNELIDISDMSKKKQLDLINNSYKKKSR